MKSNWKSKIYKSKIIAQVRILMIFINYCKFQKKMKKKKWILMMSEIKIRDINGSGQTTKTH